MDIIRTGLNLVSLLIALVLFAMIWSAKGPFWLLLNTILALIALKVIGWLGIRIEINIWSILIVAIGGLPGLLLVLLLNLLGMAF